jgi:hypothetical protein
MWRWQGHGSILAELGRVLPSLSPRCPSPRLLSVVADSGGTGEKDFVQGGTLSIVETGLNNQGLQSMTKNETVGGEAKLRPGKIIGFPGEGQGIIAVPHYTGTKAHLNASGPNGAPGTYAATFVLAKPGTRNSPENQVRFADELKGSSHLAISKPAIVHPIDPDEIQMSYTTAAGAFLFHGFPNAEGFLGKITSDPFFAINRKDAEQKATSAIQGLLSNLTSQLDIPLNIELIEVTEMATQSKGVSFVAAFPLVSMAVRAAGTFTDPEFEHAVALYREGLNSNTPLYRFLCFYKILELSRKRRERLGRQNKSATDQDRTGERIPANDRAALTTWLNALFYLNRDWDDGVFQQIFLPEVFGKKINNIFDNQLRPIRDKVAHGLLDSGDFLLLDNAEDRQTVSKWLPLLRCLARRVMKNDFKEYLEYLKEDGTIEEQATPGTKV